MPESFRDLGLLSLKQVGQCSHRRRAWWWLVCRTICEQRIGRRRLRILVAQLTTDGQITGSFRAQVFPNGDNEEDDRVDITFMDAICGCNDPIALNYDPMANFLVEGSCEFPIYGCVDELACNFDDGATTDDGTCVYSDGITDCNGDCINDADGDFVCDENESRGLLKPEVLVTM